MDIICYPGLDGISDNDTIDNYVVSSGDFLRYPFVISNVGTIVCDSFELDERFYGSKLFFVNAMLPDGFEIGASGHTLRGSKMSYLCLPDKYDSAVIVCERYRKIGVGKILLESVLRHAKNKYDLLEISCIEKPATRFYGHSLKEFKKNGLIKDFDFYWDDRELYCLVDLTN